jgi:chromosome segregation ATPase
VTDEIDRLFELPLADFTAARNALSAKLQKAGDRDAAARVKVIPKPSAAAWAINQIARKHKEELSRYLRASDRLFRAQVRAMSSSAADPDFGPASQEQKSALHALAELAEQVLEAGGHGKSRAVLDRIQSALRSAILNEKARADLEAGRVSGEVGEAGFDALAAQLAIAPEIEKARPPPKEDAEARKRSEREKKQKLENLREEERQAKAALKEAEQEIRELEKERVRAQREIEAQRRALAELETNAARISKALAEAQARRDGHAERARKTAEKIAEAD